MRGLALVVFAFTAGCGFAPSTATGGTDGAPGTGDSTGSAVADAAGSGSGSSSGCAADSDGDGVCDNVDDWPCGPKPNDPGGSHGRINGQGAFQADNIKLQNQDSRLAVVTPNQNVAFGLGYSVSVLCAQFTTCHAILELGSDSGGKKGCIFDGNVTGNGINVGTGIGTYNTNLTFPAPNRYEIRLMPARAGSCGTNWAGSAPGSNETIAYVCVH